MKLFALALIASLLTGLSQASAQDRCRAPEEVIRIEKEAVPTAQVAVLNGIRAQALLSAAKRDGAPKDLAADLIVVITDADLPFGLVILFNGGCAGKYGKINIVSLNRWLGEAI